MYIKVKATANARKESVEKISADTFKISVKQKAERSMANLRIRELLARELETHPHKLRLISGATSPSKIFSTID